MFGREDIEEQAVGEIGEKAFDFLQYGKPARAAAGVVRACDHEGS